MVEDACLCFCSCLFCCAHLRLACLDLGALGRVTCSARAFGHHEVILITVFDRHPSLRFCHHHSVAFLGLACVSREDVVIEVAQSGSVPASPRCQRALLALSGALPSCQTSKMSYRLLLGSEGVCWVEGNVCRRRKNVRRRSSSAETSGNYIRHCLEDHRPFLTSFLHCYTASHRILILSRADTYEHIILRATMMTM